MGAEPLGRELLLSPIRISEYSPAGGTGITPSSPDREGTPFSSGGRYFLIRADQSGMLEYSASGSILWEREYSSIITCVAATESMFLAGLLDGRITACGSEGQTLLDFIPGGSRIPLIYGLALSADSTRIAIISGLYPQILRILERNKDEYRELYRVSLDFELRRQIPCAFLDGGDTLAFERRGAVAILDVRKKKIDFRSSGELASAFESESSHNIVAFLCGSGETTRFKIYGTRGIVLADIPFRGRDARLSSGIASLHLGSSSSTMRFDLDLR
jgi:hypothetical protein